ncbi:MAG: preprotein translocase subunit SecA [Candidatus Omnitrophica bacterium]|nr:preprotein translocase subunit SecA [Candidatus Omnitrophota bacterium]
MFDSIIRKPVIASARRYVASLKPAVNININDDSPLPSVGEVKRLAKTVVEINSFEPAMEKLSNDQLKAKTDEFRRRIAQAVSRTAAEAVRLKELYLKSLNIDERQSLKNQYKQAEKDLYEAKEAVLRDLLPEAFAVVRETGKRLMNMRHFDVQMIGGMVLHNGNIAEMTTGEGKTLVATLAAYLNALTGDGVHVVTVNDYLAKRDREWMGIIYEFLGLTVGCIQHDMHPAERQKAYGCDITYGTNNEFGFDYLRDNMVQFKDEMVQRPHNFAIVDEVDSILVDEARTPLIISGPAEESTDKYFRAHTISLQLSGRRVTEADEIDAKHRGEDLGKGYDYVADEKAKNVSLTEQGEARAAELFGVANLHDMETIEFRHHVLQSLRAKEFFHLDTDYVVNDGKVVIVDEFTGRMMPGRRWSDGLHQAVEAKEGIKIERENQTLATITFQNYFRMYQKLSGMTGTAYTEANEFKQIYDLDVIVIPTNRPLKRVNHPDCVYKTSREKYEAVIKEIEQCHEKGQPVLVGTVSIDKSELISRMLRAKAVKHQVLNAKYHEMEAAIISQAGHFKGVTIATNMAGRGTDIMLGGNAGFMARAQAIEKIREVEKNKEELPDFDALVEKLSGQFRDQVKKEREQVYAAGGLHIIGTERHESRRIDNQLRGRSGRQGDPGSSRFYVSLEDDLMRLFAGDRIKVMMDHFGFEEGQVLESGMVSGAIEIAQKRVEGFNFEIRKQLLEYDSTMNKQREVIYGLRRAIIEGEDTRELIQESVLSTVEDAVRRYCVADRSPKDWDIDGMVVYFLDRFNFDIAALKDRIPETAPADLVTMIYNRLKEIYAEKETKFGAEQIRRLERMFLLHTIDHKWKEHLYAMDRLKEGMGLRALGQRDPLVEYKREGYHMFQTMYESIHVDVAEMIFKLQPMEEEHRARNVYGNQQQMVHQEFSGIQGTLNIPGAGNVQAGSGQPGMDAAGLTAASLEPQRRMPAAVQPGSADKVGRNDDCPCGSGKKYKKCCGK